MQFCYGGNSMAAGESSAVAPKNPLETSVGIDSRSTVLQYTANEIVFAVVGHVGSGTSTIARLLTEHLHSPSGGGFDVERLGARTEIEKWAQINGKPLP